MDVVKQEIPEENHGNLNWEEIEKICDLADFDNM